MLQSQFWQLRESESQNNCLLLGGQRRVWYGKRWAGVRTMTSSWWIGRLRFVSRDDGGNFAHVRPIRCFDCSSDTPASFADVRAASAAARQHGTGWQFRAGGFTLFHHNNLAALATFPVDTRNLFAFTASNCHFTSMQREKLPKSHPDPTLYLWFDLFCTLSTHCPLIATAFLAHRLS